MPETPGELVVVDASAFVDLLAGTDVADAVRRRLAGTVMHAPAHIDAEILSALGRLSRANTVPADAVAEAITRLEQAPLSRHPVVELVAGTWARRAEFRLVDGLYVELASRLGAPLLTTDRRLARACAIAEDLAA